MLGPCYHGDMCPATAPHPWNPELFINRELSWLEFNGRVLGEALDPSVPLLERLKFAAITSTNLDEFFMVRVAGLFEQVAAEVMDVPADGMTAGEQLEAISSRCHGMIDQLHRLMVDELLPAMSSHGVQLVRPEDLDSEQQMKLTAYFRGQVLPVLTPLAIDPGHPFPHIRNRSLNLVAILSRQHSPATQAFAVLQVPSVLHRLVHVDPPPAAEDGSVTQRVVLLEDVIAAHLGDLFPGFQCLGAWPFQVIRNFDFEIDEEEAEDLLETVKEEVRRRDQGRAVCLTVGRDMEAPAIALLKQSLQVDPRYVFLVDGPLAPQDLQGLAHPLQQQTPLLDPPFTPAEYPHLEDAEDLFDVISKGDVLLHHPYDSFDPVVDFVSRAAVDPNVLAIKQTLYRTSGDSPIVKALVTAAENGKEVAALVEIKARFDEENNIQWAQALENAGVHVIYGLLGLKTHCKVSLVVRREGPALRRYVHLGTGNYNPHTAKLYTDLSFFTAGQAFGEDATALFNLLTSCTAPLQWRKLTVAPLGFHERILAAIHRETQYALAGKPAQIIAKMNSLVDPDVVRGLYAASQAGVEIDLIVRGICCIRPQVPGISDRIRVRSVVDRFLEHSRIFYFEAGGAQDVYGSSADWMPRNFQRRVEVMFPIEDPVLKEQTLAQLRITLADNSKAHELKADGSYVRATGIPGQPTVRSQAALLEQSRRRASEAAKSEAIQRPFVVRPVRNRPTKAPDPS